MIIGVIDLISVEGVIFLFRLVAAVAATQNFFLQNLNIIVVFPHKRQVHKENGVKTINYGLEKASIQRNINLKNLFDTVSLISR